MHRVYPMLFEAEKCTGWNRDSFFFVPDFGGKITEKREREEKDKEIEKKYRLAKRLSDEFLENTGFRGSIPRSLVTQKIALSGYSERLFDSVRTERSSLES